MFDSVQQLQGLLRITLQSAPPWYGIFASG